MKRYVLLELTLEKPVDQRVLEDACASRCHSIDKVANCERVAVYGFGFIVEGPLPDGRQLTNVVIPQEVAQSAPKVFPWADALNEARERMKQ